MHRREFFRNAAMLASGAAMGLSQISSAAGSCTAATHAPTSLRASFKDYLRVGTAINSSHATGQSVGRRSLEQVEKEVALIKTQFNQITAENDMKWIGN